MEEQEAVAVTTIALDIAVSKLLFAHRFSLVFLSDDKKIALIIILSSSLFFGLHQAAAADTTTAAITEEEEDTKVGSKST